jgi:hypothetical protein
MGTRSCSRTARSNAPQAAFTSLVRRGEARGSELLFQVAYTGPVVLMCQNRQAARDRDEAEHDYEVNRDALEILRRIQKDQRHLEELLQGGAGG